MAMSPKKISAANTALAELNAQKTMSLDEFFEKNYVDFAIYRVLQRLPNLVDGFAQTQRKTIFTILDNNILEKTKVQDLMSLVSTRTRYHHGPDSIFSALTGLVPQYANVIPLLRDDGAYGCRSDRDAAAPRYIQSRLYKYTKVLFNDIDNTQFIQPQKSEGQEIEPKYMIPILPLLAINGNSQIGMGYSCNIFPRCEKTIIKHLKDLLTGKTNSLPAIIPPKFPLFTGSIEPNEKGGWLYKGIAKELKQGIVYISEIPPKYNREKFIQILEDLMPKGAEKIKSYVEDIRGDTFKITVKMLEDSHWTKTKFGDPKTATQRQNDLLNFFKLVQTATENITVINSENKIKKYNNISELLSEYIIFMLNIYNQRKSYILTELERDILKYKNIIRFINAIKNDTLIVNHKPIASINQELENTGFNKYNESYSYLLSLQIQSLTKEKVEELEFQIKKMEEEFITLEKKIDRQLWLDDIIEFEKLFEKGI